MLTLVGAVASLAIMLLVLGEPALRACVPDQRGTFACLRDATVERLNLPVGTVAETSDASTVEAVASPAPEPKVDLIVEPDAEPHVEMVAEPTSEPKPVTIAAIEPDTPPRPYIPTPGKLERPPVTILPDNVAAPAKPEAQPAPLPAETGSIETPVAPAVEALVEPELIELPQLPPPPLTPELSQSPPAIPEPAATPDTASAPLSEPPGATPSPPVTDTPADSAAAAATAIADPAQPPVPAPVLPPIRVAPPSIPMAAVPPIPPEPVPDVTAIPPAEPTIDTIAFDETGTVVAGDGPRGAVIRLYIDTELAGEGEVMDGRWEVFGAPLFAVPMQTLRAVAIEPETGRILGETEISIELELPESAAPPLLDEIVPPRPDPDPVVDAAPMPETPAPELPDAKPAPDLTAGTSRTVPPAETLPKVLPPLRTVVPRGETSSVIILPDSRSRLAAPPGSGFAILGD